MSIDFKGHIEVEIQGIWVELDCTIGFEEDDPHDPLYCDLKTPLAQVDIMEALKEDQKYSLASQCVEHLDYLADMKAAAEEDRGDWNYEQMKDRRE